MRTTLRSHYPRPESMARRYRPIDWAVFFEHVSRSLLAVFWMFLPDLVFLAA